MTRERILTVNALGSVCKTDGKRLFPVKKDEYPLEQLINDCYAADLETTTNKHYEKYEETHAWIGGIMKINDEDNRGVYYSMDEFYYYLDELTKQHYPNPVYVAFHNARFDFSFMENYMLKNGYNAVPSEGIKPNVEFKNVYSVLRNEMGALYSATIKFAANRLVKIVDFAKIMPERLASIGAALDIPKRKDLIDYHKIRPVGYLPTEKELEYLWDDIIILAKAWKIVFEEEKSFKITRSGYAYLAVKRCFELTCENPDLVKFSNFDKCFPATEPIKYNKQKYILNKAMLMNQVHNEEPDAPVPDMAVLNREIENVQDLHAAYQGGKVYCHPKYTNKKISKRMVSIDYTSLYPSQWLNHYYPTGEGKDFEGKYVQDIFYPLYIQSFEARFTMKKGGFPTLAKKLSATGKQIYSDSDLKNPILKLCDVDLKLFLDNYEIHNIVYLGGTKFEQLYAPFASFVEEYGAKKTYYGTKEGYNPILRQMSKLTLNGSYGKFGQSPFLSSKNGYIRDDVTRYQTEVLESSEMSYLPIAIWTTAYGREDLVSMIKIIGVNKVLYDDTDSIKAFCDWESTDPNKNWLLKPEVKAILKTDEFIAEHGTDFNTWEDEAHIHHFKMLRDKSYVMHTKHTLKCGIEVDGIDVKAAGLTDDAKALFTMYFDEDGRGLYFDERTGETVYAYEYEIPQENHKDLYYPCYKPWEEVFDAFDFGKEYKGCLTQKQVKGGVILVPATKILTEDTLLTYEDETGELCDILDLFL